VSYRSEVLADSPTHYWPLAEGGGLITADLETIGGSGTSLTSSLGYQGITSTDGAGLVNNSNNGGFLAIQSAAYLPNPPGVGPYGGFTMEAWVYLFGFGGTYQVALMYGVAASATFLLVDATGHANATQAGGSGTLADASALSLNRWHQLVVVASAAAPLAAAASTLYVDGASVATGNIQYKFPSSSGFGLGDYTDRTQPLNGLIGSCSLYATQLSAARVAAHHTAAELSANSPIFQGQATFNQGQQSLDLLNKIYAAVHTTFPTT
jgi:Concanavalin A-like lectin/glucanases superfamily